MKILLIGATSLLGRKIFETDHKKHTIITTYYSNSTLKSDFKLDITRKEDVKRILYDTRPSIIIHTSSLGDIDYCEQHQKEAWKVNVTSIRYLVKAAKQIRAKFIFFSSNAVFDGKKPPYSEKSETHPLNFYGKTKAAAERIVKDYFPHAVIFRLTTMYGWNNQKERKNPATWLIERLGKNLQTPVVTDVYNNHLWVGQAAQTVWKVINQNLFNELFHIAGKECVNRYEFALLVAEIFHLDKNLLIPVTSDYFTSLTPRAKKTCFDTSKMKQILKIFPLIIRSGLIRMKLEQK